jgi:2-polyprenyl-3-methyl-5-hydroxy-6-metoxy-1,4-benzoquinol methylase
MSFDRDEQRATAFFDDYVTFVTRSAGRTSADVGNRLLDVGCGAGWSSFLFAQSGHHVTGIDLNANAFEPPATEASYDVVAAYNTLEHIPEPQRALQEMLPGRAGSSASSARTCSVPTNRSSSSP